MICTVTFIWQVLGFAVFFALVVKNVEAEDEDYYRLLKDMRLTYSGTCGC